MKKRLQAAVKKFESFTGLEASKVTKVHIPDPPEVTVILGELVGVIYKTEKTETGSRPREFIHKFKKRPLLLTDTKGKYLYIAGGKIRVTDRGIEG